VRTRLLALAAALLALAGCSGAQRAGRSMDEVLEGFGGTNGGQEGARDEAAIVRTPKHGMDVTSRVALWASEIAPVRSTRATGRPYDGRLARGVELPDEGPGYVTRKPWRHGTWQLIHTMMTGVAEVLLRHPDTVPVVVGDLSRKGGGRLKPHRSHQSGLDVDIGYYFKGNRYSRWRFVPADAATLDADKTLTLIEGMLRTGWVDMIFIDTRIQRLLHTEARARGWSEELLDRVFEVHRTRSARTTIIRHSRGHHDHLHLRVKCDPECDLCQ
jgi:murein endopeptidase